MTAEQKKSQLQSIIDEKLLPLIDNEYVLYGLPYYKNVGDVLIWEGELEFLKKIRHKCVGTCAWDNYPKIELPHNVIILITGGGYFGDMWRNAFENVLKGIEKNKNNKIIFLPNTVFYNESKIMEEDVKYLSLFPNLIICARDNVSFKILKNNFKNDVVLVPDMAFYIKTSLINKWARKRPKRNILYFKRNDKEFPGNTQLLQKTNIDIHDWNSMEKDSFQMRTFNQILYRKKHLSKINFKLAFKFSSWLYKNMFRKILIKEGCSQLSAYQHIITTRLHAMILGCMLNRQVKMIDNNYGKLSSFYYTWLNDCDNVTVYENP